MRGVGTSAGEGSNTVNGLRTVALQGRCYGLRVAVRRRPLLRSVAALAGAATVWIAAPSSAGAVTPLGKRIDLELQDVPMEKVLDLFRDVGRVNIVVEGSPQVRVSAFLRDVPWIDALRQILAAHGLGMRWEGNVIYVARAR